MSSDILYAKNIKTCIRCNPRANATFFKYCSVCSGRGFLVDWDKVEKESILKPPDNPKKNV